MLHQSAVEGVKGLCHPIVLWHVVQTIYHITHSALPLQPILPLPPFTEQASQNSLQNSLPNSSSPHHTSDQYVGSGSSQGAHSPRPSSILDPNMSSQPEPTTSTLSRSVILIHATQTQFEYSCLSRSACILSMPGDGPVLCRAALSIVNDPFCHHLLESRSPLGPPMHGHMPTL
jgi:hypothetical protein